MLASPRVQTLTGHQLCTDFIWIEIFFDSGFLYGVEFSEHLISDHVSVSQYMICFPGNKLSIPNMML